MSVLACFYTSCFPGKILTLPCFLSSIGLCLSVFGATCLCGCIHPTAHKTHLYDAGVLAFLALHHPFGFPCFFTFLHACLHVHAWVCVSSILQSHGTMDTRSKPTFVLLECPILFDNMFVCPHLASFPSLSLACLSFHLFICLSTGLFLLSLHVHAWSEDTWSKGATS